MTNSAEFDRNILAAVKPGMDSTLAEISAQLELYLAAPADNAAALEKARAELHSLLGVLKMVGLEGVAVCCAELVLTLSELAPSPQQVSAMHRDVLRRVLFSITHYLDALSNGADNAALRLFPQYQELQQLRGMEMAFELDLFYPNLEVQLPSEVLGSSPQSDAMSRIKVLRSQYQQGLLRWLRQEEASEAVQQMQQALDGALRCQAQDNSRAFWWIANGLLDCMKLDGLPPEMNIRKLLGRIDQQFRMVADGTTDDINPVLNEMLYAIGRSHVVSERVEEIKKIYDLDSYLPELSALPPGEVDQLLGVMRDQLRVAEESWELCSQGDKVACEKFVKYAELLSQQSDKLDRDVLRYLTKQIQTLSQYANSPEFARPISMDMAMALLLLGSGIENYNRLGSGFQEQARILIERMQAVVKQQPEDTRRMTELVDLHYQMEQRGDVMGPLANEMLVNLQHVEQGLNAFFNDAIKRDELTELLRLLSQIRGGLLISSLDHAERLLTSIQDNVRRFARGTDTPRPMERYALADAISALENYMQHLTHGQSGDVWRLQDALAEMQKLEQAPAAAAPVESAKVALAPVAPIPVISAKTEAVPIEQPRVVAPAQLAPAMPPKAEQPQQPPSAEIPWIPESLELPSIEQPRLPESSLEFTPVEQPQVAASLEFSSLEIPSFGQAATEPAPSEPLLSDLTWAEPVAEPTPPEPAQAETPYEQTLIFEKSPLAEPEAIPPVEQVYAPAQARPPKTVSAETTTTKQPQVTEPATRPTDEEMELLEIFLEEAQEVLGSIRGNLDKCQLHPDSREPLVEIRRGFHTLKGSGRMVGLTDLGEVAWCVERAMNSWLQDNKPATSGLLLLINRSVQAFGGWVEMLSKQGTATIEADELIAAAQQIENGTEPVLGAAAVPAAQELPMPQMAAMPVAQEPVQLPEIKDELETEEEIVVAGEITLSPALFNIASAEARQNVAVLHHQFEELRAEAPPVIQYDFMRAAHTLAGVNRTMGFTAVVELASALEGWLQARMEKLFLLSDSQVQMLEQSIAALDGMVQRICDKQMPQMRSDLTQQLLADKEKLGEIFVEPIREPEKDKTVAVAPEMMPPFDFAPAEIIRTEVATPEFLLPEFAPMEPLAEAPRESAQAPAPEEFPAERFAFTEEISEPVTVVEPEKIAEPAKAKPAKVEPAKVELASVPPTELQPIIVTVAKPTEARVDAEKPQVYDDLDEQLLPVFLEEADDLGPKIGEGLRAWREHPHDEPQVQSLKRLLHTMKGSSRMVGAMRIGEIAHEMEDRVAAPAQLREEADYWDTLDNDFDRINALLEELRGGKPVVAEARPIAAKTAEAKVTEAGPEVPGRRTAVQPGAERRAGRRAPDIATLGNVLRVRAEVVDRLVNEAGEIAVTRSRIETEMRVFREGLLELTGSVIRLRQQLREVEIQAESQMQARVTLAKESSEQFDPLEFDRFTRLQELTRFMNESVHDVQTVQQSMLKNLDDTNAVMLAQSRLNRELQQGLMNVRMVSFNSIADRLYRIVRQTGKELNKRANLELQGTGVELDRSVLEKMVAPFEHLLRNSIVHGLEGEQQRAQRGKLPIGEIRLSVRQESNEVVFEFSDDGAGLNFDRLREKAIAGGTLQADEEASEDQLAQLIFMPGISTATEITEIAGRGVGMDVVRSEITALGGRIEVSSQRGLGTQFVIHLPLTLAVSQILMVRSGDEIYAIPATMVEQVRQLKASELDNLYREQKIEWLSVIYPLYYLPHMLGRTEAAREMQPRNTVLLLRSGIQRVALHIDELLGNQEAMVKNVGPQLARMQGIAGATVMGDGSVVLILNPVQLAQRIGAASKSLKAAAAKPANAQPVIMVVDDSLTVRKITTRMLLRAGYQVVTATDGVDALEKLEECTPEVMLLDIEMPRMDGFALAKQLRRDPKTKDLPIIMITSRTADKHREYAMQLGVNTYLGKPYQEDDLLQNIADFVAEHK